MVDFHAEDRKAREVLRDLQALQEWIAHSPPVPSGKLVQELRYVYKLCGEGDTPLTFLEKDQIPYGEEVE